MTKVSHCKEMREGKVRVEAKSGYSPFDVTVFASAKGATVIFDENASFQ